MTNIPEAIRRELNQAQAARIAEKEGMARVCARRAAGLAIGEYLRQNQLADPGPSALDRLEYLKALPQTTNELQQSLRYLTQRVNEEYELPAGIDLITEAGKLIAALLPQFPQNEA